MGFANCRLSTSNRHRRASYWASAPVTHLSPSASARGARPGDSFATMRRRIASLAVAAVAISAAPAAAEPIVPVGTPSLPAFSGAPATANEIQGPDDRAAEPVHGRRTRTPTSTTTPG